MAEESLTYARAGGPPDNWTDLRVFNAETGDEIKDVVEVNTAEGWLLRYKQRPNGEPVYDPATQSLVIERIPGKFRIEEVRP